jgi:hypothetical protein
MSSSPEKEETKIPSFPEDYVVPDVWKFEPQDGVMGGMNRPTAGARKEQTLPRGEHDIQLYSLCGYSEWYESYHPVRRTQLLEGYRVRCVED